MKTFSQNTHIYCTHVHRSELEIETSHPYIHTRAVYNRASFMEMGGGMGWWGREERGRSFNPLGFSDIITSQLHTSSTFSFQTGFHAKSRQSPGSLDWEAHETHKCVSFEVWWETSWERLLMQDISDALLWWLRRCVSGALWWWGWELQTLTTLSRWFRVKVKILLKNFWVLSSHLWIVSGARSFPQGIESPL